MYMSGEGQQPSSALNFFIDEGPNVYVLDGPTTWLSLCVPCRYRYIYIYIYIHMHTVWNSLDIDVRLNIGQP